MPREEGDATLMQRITKQGDVIQTSDIKHLHACICLRDL